MHVCLYGYNLGVLASGSSRFTHDLAKALVRDGYVVTIASNGSPAGALRLEGVNYLSLGSSSRRTLPGDPLFVASSLARFVRQRDHFDIIHSVSGWPRFALAAQVVSRAAGVPVIHSALAPASHRWWFRGVDRVHCTSSTSAQQLGNAVYIPPFIDLDRFSEKRDLADLNTTPVRIGILGAPDPRKGIDVFVRTIPLVAQQHPGATFHLAIAPEQVKTDKGLGRTVAWARDFLNAQGLNGRVHIEGDVDVPSFLAQLDIFVFPVQSPHGMVDPPLTILEAMAAQCAIVTSEVSGVKDVLRHGTNACLVGAEERSDPKRYAEHISALVADTAMRRRLAKRAHDDAAQYDVRRLAPAFESLYHDVANGRR